MKKYRILKMLTEIEDLIVVEVIESGSDSDNDDDKVFILQLKNTRDFLMKEFSIENEELSEFQLLQDRAKCVNGLSSMTINGSDIPYFNKEYLIETFLPVQSIKTPEFLNDSDFIDKILNDIKNDGDD